MHSVWRDPEADFGYDVLGASIRPRTICDRPVTAGITGAASLTGRQPTAAWADRLASDVAAAYPAVAVAAGPPDPAGHDVVINATSLGMRPGDPLPVLVDRLAPGTLVCDIVTRPEETQLLREAAARGCVLHPGLPMLPTRWT